MNVKRNSKGEIKGSLGFLLLAVHFDSMLSLHLLTTSSICDFLFSIRKKYKVTGQSKRRWEGQSKGWGKDQ